MTDIDVDSPLAVALRALQILDEIAPFEWLVENRHLLLAAQDHLADELGLACTGFREIGERLAYDHGKRGRGAEVTCPVHEWLVPDDYELTIPKVLGAV